MLKRIIGKIWRKTPQFFRAKLVRLTQSEFTVSVAVVIENENGEVLLLDHVFRPASGWGIPGGFIERGEQPEQTARREILEETGLEIKDLKFFRARTSDRHIEIVCHARASGTPQIKSVEINGFGWFRVGELPEKLSDGQKNTIKELLKNNL